MARPREFDEDEVVTKATEVFHAKGYRGTAPRDLLEATGLAKSSLYSAFGSKQGLFERALERYVEFQQTGMRQMLEGGTLRDALTRMYDAVILSNSTEAGARSCLMCTASIEVDRDDADLLERIGKFRGRVERVIAARIEEAQDAGEVDTDRDAHALARFVMTNNMGLVVLARVGATSNDLRAVADEVIACVCGG